MLPKIKAHEILCIASEAVHSHILVQKTSKMSTLNRGSSVMFWAGVPSTGKTPLVFIVVGAKTRLASYEEKLLEPVVKNLN